MSIMLASIILGLLAFIYVRGFKAKMAAYSKMAPPPTAVTTLVTKAQTWQHRRLAQSRPGRSN